jgi:hypothetical protein
LAGIASVAASLAIASNAGAATMTLGSPLKSTFSMDPANAVGTFAMTSGPNIVAPVDGTVISWRMVHFTGGPFHLRIIRLVSATEGAGDGTGPPLILGPSGAMSEQAVNLPIKAGEVVGVDNSNTSDQIGSLGGSADYLARAWVPPLPDGGVRTQLFQAPVEYSYNATLRYCLVPKLKGKKLGAARTALANAACALGSVKKKKGQKFVRSQSAPAGSQLADGASVDVKLGKKKARRK